MTSMEHAPDPTDHAKKRGTKRASRWNAVATASAEAKGAVEDETDMPIDGPIVSETLGPRAQPAPSPTPSPPSQAAQTRPRKAARVAPTPAPPARPPSQSESAPVQAVTPALPRPPPPPPSASAAAPLEVELPLSQELASSNLEQFGGFESAAVELFDVHIGRLARHKSAHAVPPLAAHVDVRSAAPHAEFWELLKANKDDHRAILTWGDLRARPWANALDAELSKFAARVVPVLAPFVNPMTFGSRFTAMINRLPVIPESPLLPLLNLLHSTNVLATPHRNTIAERIRAFSCYQDENEMAFDIPLIGLEHPRRFMRTDFAPFGTMLRNGVRVISTWTSPSAPQRYAETFNVSVSHGTANLSPGGVAAADKPAPASPTDSKTQLRASFVARIGGVCTSLHRLATALAVSDEGRPVPGDSESRDVLAPLARIASSASEARALLRASFEKAKAAADTEVRRATRGGGGGGEEANRAASLRRLAATWSTVRIDETVASLRARMETPPADLMPLEDVGAEARNVGQIVAELRPLLTALRDASILSDAQRLLERVFSTFLPTIDRMRTGSVAVRARLDQTMTESRHAYERARELSTLVPTTLVDGTVVHVTSVDPAVLVRHHRERCARVSELFERLLQCHPSVLTAAIVDTIAEARVLTQFEREALTRLWSEYARAAIDMIGAVEDLMFSTTDVGTLTQPLRGLGPPVEGDAVLGAELQARLGACIERCYSAKSRAQRASPPASMPPTAKTHRK